MVQPSEGLFKKKLDRQHITPSLLEKLLPLHQQDYGFEHMGKRYSELDNQFIRLNYQALTYFEIGLLIDRDPRSVRERARLMGLRKINRREWTRDECFTFLTNITLADRELASMLGRNKQSVSAKRAWFRRKIN
jgi:hypothetical protein|tara:strand:+ start:418 stop:819 length:402 start_codon:yes stop_codon:yes gene_type:complete